MKPAADERGARNTLGANDDTGNIGLVVFDPTVQIKPVQVGQPVVEQSNIDLPFGDANSVRTAKNASNSSARFINAVRQSSVRHI